MLLKAQFAESAQGVDGANLLARLIGEEGDRDRDQSAHEMRVAIAPVMEDRSARRVPAFLPLQPDLADAAPHLVGVVMRLFAQRLEVVTEFEHITIAILPLVEQGEIVADRLERRHEDLAASRRNTGIACEPHI